MHRPAVHNHPRVEAANLAVMAKLVASLAAEAKAVASLVASLVVAVVAKAVASLVASLVVAVVAKAVASLVAKAAVSLVANLVANLVAKIVVVANLVAKPVVRGQAANLDLAVVRVAPGEDGVEQTLDPATHTSRTSGTSISGLSTTAKVCFCRTA